ncbi:MAG: DNA-protecting protein DprA [Ruminococcaceae bacterium]|nr:DNA-protecting protein DprA [Oscillospiraceae bacterium]
MLIHWIWLATRPDLSDRQKIAVLEAFRDPEEVFYAEQNSYSDVSGLTQAGAEALADKNLTAAREILDACVDMDIGICTYHDGAYPARLKNIADPPIVLYYKGKLAGLDSSPVIGVVGTRKASVYGITTAKKMGYQIAKSGGILVSGLAEGIDGSAMSGALTAGGMVVGILGCGVDVVYPAMHRSLYRDTEKNGCLISEFPPKTPPYKWNFPKRNRLISGLSHGVLVVEAPHGSGSLITARQAADQGRDVFVVPGNIDVNTFQGSNALLRDGAIAVSCGWDVVSEYAALYPDKIRRAREESAYLDQPERVVPMVAEKPVKEKKNTLFHRKNDKKGIDKEEKKTYSNRQDILADLTPEEQALLKPLQNGEALVDDLIAQSGLPAGKVLSMLTILQIRGVVELLPGKRITLK